MQSLTWHYCMRYVDQIDLHFDMTFLYGHIHILQIISVPTWILCVWIHIMCLLMNALQGVQINVYTYLVQLYVEWCVYLHACTYMTHILCMHLTYVIAESCTIIFLICPSASIDIVTVLGNILNQVFHTLHIMCYEYQYITGCANDENIHHILYNCKL